MPEPLLQVDNLKMYFPVRSGIFLRQAGWVKAVDDVSFNICPGETLLQPPTRKSSTSQPSSVFPR